MDQNLTSLHIWSAHEDVAPTTEFMNPFLDEESKVLCPKCKKITKNDVIRNHIMIEHMIQIPNNLILTKEEKDFLLMKDIQEGELVDGKSVFCERFYLILQNKLCFLNRIKKYIILKII